MKKLVGILLLALVLYIVIASAVLLFMPFTASAATPPRPVDRACMRYLNRTTNQTYTERKRHCRVRSRTSVTVSAAQVGHQTVEWWVGHEFITTRAIFEIEKTGGKWYVTDAQCWVARSIIYSTEITRCAGRRGDIRLHMDMTFRASFLAFEWPLDVGITRSIHSWRTVRDVDDVVTDVKMEG